MPFIIFVFRLDLYHNSSTRFVKQIFCLCVAAHSSFCGSMNVKDLVTEDASHLNLNGSLCKYPQKASVTHDECVDVIDRVNDMHTLSHDVWAEVV